MGVEPALATHAWRGASRLNATSQCCYQRCPWQPPLSPLHPRRAAYRELAHCVRGLLWCRARPPARRPPAPARPPARPRPPAPARRPPRVRAIVLRSEIERAIVLKSEIERPIVAGSEMNRPIVRGPIVFISETNRPIVLGSIVLRHYYSNYLGVFFKFLLNFDF